MKILCFNYSTNNLATMIRCLELARGASQHGHQVTLCFMHRRFAPPEFFHNLLRSFEGPGFRIIVRNPSRSGVHCGVVHPSRTVGPPQGAAVSRHTRPRRSMAGLLRQALVSLRYIVPEIKLVRQFKPDVIVARPDMIFSFLLSSCLTRRPLVLSTDGPAEELSMLWGVTSRLPIVLDAWRMRRAAALLAVSSVCAKLMRAKGIPDDRVVLCPNGADPEFFKPLGPERRSQMREQLGLEGAQVIGFSGNQVAYHGVGQLLATCVPILRDNPQARILLVGTIKAEEALELEQLPEDLRDGRIVLTGSVPYSEMPGYIDCADIMVMPYPPLPMFFFSPMKLFEALAMGKIIVSSRQGQLDEVLPELPCAFLYDPNSRDGLKHAIEQALDALNAGKDGKIGRELLIREHTWRHRGRSLAIACERALARPGRTCA
jgi:glycosyltransferase involved in cell wall biosynthesis